MRNILIVFFMITFLSPCMAQDDPFGFFEETEDIACEDLPSAFKKYNQDVQLNQSALVNTLRQTVKLLNAISQEDTISKSKISHLVNKLEEAIALSYDNEFSLLNRFDNIKYVLPDCLSKSSSN